MVEKCNSQIKIVFFGSTLRSVYILKSLLNKPQYQIIAVVSQSDQPVGRKKVLTPTPVSSFAKKLNLPLLLPKSDPKKPFFYQDPKKVATQIEKLKPYLLIIADYGQKIPRTVLCLATFGGINLHPSLLPKYRGATPVPWAILNGEKETGITILKLSHKFDQGEIIAQQYERIFPTDTSEILLDRLFKKGAKLLVKILPDYLARKIKLKKQDESCATYYPRLTRQDGFINPKDFKKALEGKNIKKASLIERKIRAFYPWPGTWTSVSIQDRKTPRTVTRSVSEGTPPRWSKKRLKILKAHIEGKKLILDQIQLEGKTPVSFSQFKQGYPNFKLTN